MEIRFPPCRADLAREVPAESEQQLASDPMDLPEGRATGDVEILLPLVQFIARQRGEVPGSGAVEMDGGSERELLGPLASAHATAPARS